MRVLILCSLCFVTNTFAASNASAAQWEYRTGNSWVPYGPKINAQLNETDLPTKIFSWNMQPMTSRFEVKKLGPNERHDNQDGTSYEPGQTVQVGLSDSFGWGPYRPPCRRTGQNYAQLVRKRTPVPQTNGEDTHTADGLIVPRNDPEPVAPDFDVEMQEIENLAPSAKTRIPLQMVDLNRAPPQWGKPAHKPSPPATAYCGRGAYSLDRLVPPSDPKVSETVCTEVDYVISEKFALSYSNDGYIDGITRLKKGDHELDFHNVVKDINRRCRAALKQPPQQEDAPMYFFHGGKNPTDKCYPPDKLWTEADLGQDFLFWPAASALKVHGQHPPPRNYNPCFDEPKGRSCLEDAPAYLGSVSVWKITNADFYHMGGSVNIVKHNEKDLPSQHLGDRIIGARKGYRLVTPFHKFPDAYIMSKKCIGNAMLKPVLVFNIRNPYSKLKAGAGK